MLVCQQCGYALYRSSTRTSKRKLYYYRCLGSDAYRHFKGALCTNRPVRSDYLDQFVWGQIIGLLDNGTLIQAEIDRRKEAARNSDPRRQRSETLRREQARVLVAADSLTIRHSIPIPQTGAVSNGPHPTGSYPSGASQKPGYLLRSGSNHCSLRCSYLTLRPLAVFRDSRLQPFLDQAQDPAIGYAMLDKLHRPFVAHVVKEASNVRIEHPVHALPLDAHRQRVQRLMWAAAGSEPVRESFEVHS
jgi:hypothetical protein